MLHSGIYIRVGPETKDLITECTVSELQEWLKSKNYDAFTETIGLERMLKNPVFRIGFLLGIAARYGITVHKLKPEYDKFMENL